MKLFATSSGKMNATCRRVLRIRRYTPYRILLSASRGALILKDERSVARTGAGQQRLAQETALCYSTAGCSLLYYCRYCGASSPARPVTTVLYLNR